MAQEGEQTALVETAGILVSCLSSPEGCIRVPGLSDDLFFLTLGTSAVGGAVFGFALRQETTEQVRGVHVSLVPYAGLLTSCEGPSFSSHYQGLLLDIWSVPYRT